MNDKMKKGFFSADLLNIVAACRSLKEAKTIALLAIEQQPNARGYNIERAKYVINNAASIKALLVVMTNFMLSHPSENLGMKNRAGMVSK